jgi:hypothetical protein
MPYIHCLSCGDDTQRRIKPEEPGEHCWFVRGFAKQDMLCDACNKSIRLGDKCQATTFYTNETGYKPWESEFLDCMDKGTSGVKRVLRESTPTLKVLTVFACREGGSYSYKVPEIEMYGYAGGDLESLEEEIYNDFSIYDYTPDAFEEDLARRGGKYAFDIHVVGAAEFGPFDDEPDEEDWEE